MYPPREVPPLLRVQDSGFRAQGSGFRVQGSRFRVQGSGFRVQGSGFRVQMFALPRLTHRYVLPPTLIREVPLLLDVSAARGARPPSASAFSKRQRVLH